MILEARAANCFASTYVLKIKGRPVGKVESQWFSENLSIQLTERRHLEFRKVGWFASQFELIDLADEEIVGSCARSGLFSTSWELNLKSGPGQLVRPGWLDTAYEFSQEGEVLARVDRIGWCERGWTVDGAAILPTEDLILIGVLYQVIQKRRHQQNNAGGAAAGT